MEVWKKTTSYQGGERLSRGLEELWEKGARLPRLSPQKHLLEHSRRALDSLRQNLLTSLSSLFTIAISLMFLGLFLLFIRNVDSVLQTSRADLSFQVYFREGTPQAFLEETAKSFDEDPEIRQWRMVSKEEALEKFREMLGPEDAMLARGLEGLNPLPLSLEFDFHPGEGMAEKVRARADFFRALPEVEYVHSGQESMITLQKLLSRLRFLGSFVVFLILLLSAFLISSSIQLALYSRRNEIEIMNLVGATDRFVRAPFLVEGFLLGLGGALLALVSLGGLAAFLDQVWQSSDLFALLGFEFLSLHFSHAILVLVLGLAVGVLGSFFAVQRFLRLGGR